MSPGCRQSSTFPPRVLIARAVVVAMVVLLANCSEGNSTKYSVTARSTGMSPTIEVGDKVSGTTEVVSLDRGDIIVFRAPPGALDTERLLLIYRIVGLPGETVEGRSGRILINGQPLDETYLPSDTRTSDFAPQQVPADHLWVLGDKRDTARDSRYYLSIPKDTVVAHVTKIESPASRKGPLR